MPTLRERWNAFFRPIVYYFAIGNDAPTSVLNYTAKQLYCTQANLRAVVDYLSNSIAQLPLKVYTRNDETARLRDRTYLTNLFNLVMSLHIDSTKWMKLLFERICLFISRTC